MAKVFPKLCINSTCMNVLYVPAYKLHMCLQCEACIERRAQCSNA